MSGQPNVTEVKKLREALKGYRNVLNEVNEIERDQDRLVVKLRDKKELLGKFKNEIYSILESMDVRATGNAGWEQRYFSLLSIMSEATNESNQLSDSR